LRAVRDANRREDVWVERIFTLIPAAENPNIVEYGVDADERFEYLHHPGEIYTRNSAPVSIEHLRHRSFNVQMEANGFPAGKRPQ
jgi:hypothetical protein